MSLLRLHLPTSYRDVELLEVPGLAVVDLNDRLMQRIRELQMYVVKARAYQISEFNYEAVFTQAEEDEEGRPVPGEPMRTECNELVVHEEYFFFQCYAKHSDVTISTECVYFDNLDAFAAPDSITRAMDELLNMAEFAMNVNPDAWPDGKEAMDKVGEFIKDLYSKLEKHREDSNDTDQQ